MIQDGQLLNYIGGKWRRSRTSEFLDVRNPATAEAMVRVPLSLPDEVDEAAQAAGAASAAWRQTPPVDRIQYLFKLRKLLDDHFDEIARLTVDECGKTMAESQGELRLSGYDTSLVLALCHCLRQLLHSQALREGANDNEPGL